jgi:hypothetical protein
MYLLEPPVPPRRDDLRFLQVSDKLALEPERGVEPPTFALQKRCSTTELLRRMIRGVSGAPDNVARNPAKRDEYALLGTSEASPPYGGETSWSRWPELNRRPTPYHQWPRPGKGEIWLTHRLKSSFAGKSAGELGDLFSTLNGVRKSP